MLAEMPLPIRDTSRNNKQSIVFSFTFENHSLLLTGDAWAEDVIKAKGTYALVKLPHHGSARNISETYPGSIHSSDFLICTDGINHCPLSHIDGQKIIRYNGKERGSNDGKQTEKRYTATAL